MKNLKLKAPAKINLRLDVFQKRPDGYHEIQMLNTAVSLFDDIELSTIDRGVEVECIGDAYVPSGDQNVAYLAAKEIMAYSNKNIGVKIKIQKNIPSAAGLGGGSSDAASVLLGINQMLNIHLPREKLIKVSLRFGSDVPFFLFGSPAIATGIGENLEKVKKLPKMPILIITPDVKVLTKTIYERYRFEARETEELAKAYPTKKALFKVMRNDLESVTARLYPVVSDVKNLLLKWGANVSQMSGSGPSVFGIFPDEAKAQKAYKNALDKASKNGWKVFLVENV